MEKLPFFTNRGGVQDPLYRSSMAGTWRRASETRSGQALSADERQRNLGASNCRVGFGRRVPPVYMDDKQLPAGSASVYRKMGVSIHNRNHMDKRSHGIGTILQRTYRALLIRCDSNTAPVQGWVGRKTLPRCNGVLRT